MATDFEFVDELWVSEQLPDILTQWDDFDSAHAESTWKGGDLAANHADLPLVRFMLEEGTWPVRPIVLDNRDGFVDRDPDNPNYELPRAFILIEGHTRFNIALHLRGRGALVPEHLLWLMRGAKG